MIRKMKHGIIFYCSLSAYIVQALMSIKSYLVDPHSALYNWDDNAVDPCSWAMVTCSADHFVIAL